MSIDIMEQPGFAAEKSSKGARILIIDGDDISIDVLAHRLAQQGFRTTAAETGNAGLDAVRTEQPDLILLDARLPDTDGFELCRHLSDSPETCLIPIILFSDSDDACVVRDARAAGARYFLNKQYDPNVLWLVIQDSLKKIDNEW